MSEEKPENEACEELTSELEKVFAQVYRDLPEEYFNESEERWVAAFREQKLLEIETFRCALVDIVERAAQIPKGYL